MPHPQVIVLTVTYGKRWNFLLQVITATMKDPHVTKLIIVDNGSKNKEEIVQGTKEYGERIVVLRQERNLGSAGGFALGLAYVRTLEGDFVFLLDDDNVPEDGAISTFLDLYKLFPDEKVVLVGNRVGINMTQNFFYDPPTESDSSEKRMFELFRFSRFLKKVSSFFDIGNKKQKIIPFTPVVPLVGFAYGGSFIPLSIVCRAPLPDASLVLYGDDSEYSKGISRLGYGIYLCAEPRIHDVDVTFISGGNVHQRVPNSFNKKTPAFKVYFSIRNMVRISIFYRHWSNPLLFLKIVIWTFVLCIRGFLTSGYNHFYRQRVALIIRAVYGGYRLGARIPEEAMLP